ncbi:MAG: TIM barrel protein [Acidobacteria bacterium]|nr:TIM barrel protein [Acidobacteriota bacterium]
MFQLSLCAEVFFAKLPFPQRVQEINRRGFLAEFWTWPRYPMEALAADPQARISIFGGTLAGSMMHPDGVEAFLEGVEQSAVVAKSIRCRNLILLTGELGSRGEMRHQVAEHPATRWITAYRTLCRVAELAEKHGLTFSLEHLNAKVDHAGYPLPRPADAAALIRQVGSPRIKLLLDIYHAQVEQGNVIQAIRDSHDLIGHVHVADVPGRHEPGTGELHYGRVAQALREVGYQGVVGMEAWPEGDEEEAIERFRETFSEKPRAARG